jgi:predicted neutral ceramidase superfamily lipid hydrolase
MRDAITAASGVTAANIMVTVTHCFSAPHVQASSSSAGAAAYVQNIVAATKSAVSDAVANLQDAEVGYGSGRVDVNVNRNVLTADGY